MSASVSKIVAPVTLLDKIKAWFYVASNRTATIAFLTSALATVGHVADKSIPLYAALPTLIYGLVHLIFPDFAITPAQIATIATDAGTIAAVVETKKVPS